MGMEIKEMVIEVPEEVKRLFSEVRLGGCGGGGRMCPAGQCHV